MTRSTTLSSKADEPSVIGSVITRKAIVTDIVLVLFSFLNIPVIIYSVVKLQTRGCGEAYIIGNCVNPSYGGVYMVVEIIFGLLYAALIIGILLKSSTSLYRNVKTLMHKE